MAINTQKLLPSSASSSAIVKADTPKISTKKITADSIAPIEKSDDQEKNIIDVKVKVLEIDKLLKGSFVAKKKQEAKERKEAEAASRAEKEKGLEKKDKKKKKEVGLSLPGKSFLDRIKDFILNTLLGYGLVRLVDYIPQLMEFVKGLGAIAEFIIGVGGVILNGLVTLIDWGYRLYESFRGFIGDTFGQEGLKKFDELSKNLNTFLNAAIIAGLAFLRFGFLRKGVRALVGTFRSIFRRGLVRALKRLSLKFFGKGATQLIGKGLSATSGVLSKVASSVGTKLAATKVGGFVAKLFGKAANIVFPIFKEVAPKVSGFAKRIPILGPIIAAVFSLLAGEPPAQALFKGLGAALGGALGTFIPIPVVGTLLGETIGIFVGDLLYELILGKGPEAAFTKLKDGFGAIFKAGAAIGKFLASGFSRFFPNFFKKHPIELFDGGGVRTAITTFAKLTNMYGFLKDVGYAGGKDGQIDKFPNLLQLYNPFSMLPLVFESFFPSDPDAPTPNVNAFGFGVSQLDPSVEFAGVDTNYSGQGLEDGETSETSTEQGKVDPINIEKSNNIVKIGKDLVSKGFSVAEHPDFTKTPTGSGGAYTPGQGFVSNVHRGRGHYESRAIDVTDWRGSLEDSKARYRSVLESIYNNGDMGKKLLIHDSWGIADETGKDGPGRHGHPEHMHIEVKDKGGKIGKGLFANLGGPEYVLDADTTKALEDNLPGFLSELNQANYNNSLKVLRNYASYEGQGVKIIPVQIPSKPAGKTTETYQKQTSGGVSISMPNDTAWKDNLYIGG